MSHTQILREAGRTINMAACKGPLATTLLPFTSKDARAISIIVKQCGPMASDGICDVSRRFPHVREWVQSHTNNHGEGSEAVISEIYRHGLHLHQVGAL